MKHKKNKSNLRTHEVKLILWGTFTVQHTGEQTMEQAVADTLSEFQTARKRFENEYGSLRLTSMTINGSPMQLPKGVV